LGTHDTRVQQRPLGQEPGSGYLELAGEALLAGMTREQVIA
jgi:hypothetical protein